MDKSDVEMEDAEKQPQEKLNNLKESEDVGIPDAKPEQSHGQELPSPDMADAQLSVQVEEKTEHQVDTVLEEQNNSKIELQDQNNVTQIGVDGTSNAKGVGDYQSIAKFEVEDRSFANSEVEDKSKAKGVEEDQNKAKDEAEERNKAEGGAEEGNKAKGEAEEQNMAEAEPEVQNMAEGVEEERLNAENETKDQMQMESAAKEQNCCENSKEVEDSVDSLMDNQKAPENAEEAKNHSQNGQLPFQLPVSEVPPKKKEAMDEVHHSECEGMVKGVGEEVHQSETGGLVNGRKEPENRTVQPAAVRDENVKLGENSVTKEEVGDTPLGNKPRPITPDFPVKYSSKRSGSHTGDTFKNVSNDAQMPEGDDGTPEEQAAFIREFESFYRESGVEFKPPKFYGQPLNCYKLWRAVIRLGGYDQVTGSKLWRQVGESFHPPKTCTTVSWTFRIFYEKSLLEFERYKRQSGELQLPVAALPEPSSIDNEGNGYQASGSGRARRDAAARAMQGWHVQRLSGYGEVGEPIIKDKSPNNMQKRENKLKSIGSLKQKRPSEIELPLKAQRTETYKQLVTTVVDVGPPADWVKINVRETKDCFEVYALVPGLLREEVRVQSDPAGRLVITGQPEQPDNPWGITAFKKVVSLPARIDPLQTSAVVSLHGRLLVRVPFEPSNI